MIKSGNRFLRYYLLEAANSVRGCDPEFQRYYDLKYHEVNMGQHKRALALTARKLVRLVFRLLKGNRLYTRGELISLTFLALLLKHFAGRAWMSVAFFLSSPPKIAVFLRFFLL